MPPPLAPLVDEVGKGSLPDTTHGLADGVRCILASPPTVVSAGVSLDAEKPSVVFNVQCDRLPDELPPSFAGQAVGVTYGAAVTLRTMSPPSGRRATEWLRGPIRRLWLPLYVACGPAWLRRAPQLLHDGALACVGCEVVATQAETQPLRQRALRGPEAYEGNDDDDSDDDGYATDDGESESDGDGDRDGNGDGFLEDDGDPSGDARARVRDRDAHDTKVQEDAWYALLAGDDGLTPYTGRAAQVHYWGRALTLTLPLLLP